MSERFPHLTNNESSFPDLESVNVYQYDNDFNYNRYDYTQMKVTVCTVPWDMGEAHVGNRTIEGIGNVVAFADKAARDAWFASIPASECYRFETKFKDLHRDNVIDIPLPFDIAARYNYIAVEYSLFANDGSPVQYENADGLRKWFWFIREVEFLSPNATRVHLMIDAWQTFIYDIEIGAMMLERGHAPMFNTTVAQYLADPNDNCADLLAPDVNYGNNAISKHQSAFVLNDANMVCLVVSSANPFQAAQWGSKANNDWNVHANGHFQTQGVPSLCAFALDPANLSQWLFNIDANFPQFMQTIRAISFVADKLVTLGNSYTFAGYSIYEVTSSYTQHDLYALAKADFGYPAKYAEIAKLYTYPYAYIEVTDENGNVNEIHVEDTNGRLQVETAVNLVFPWLNITANLTGVGKSARAAINFKNVTDRTFYVQGNWYDYVSNWQIPTYVVTQDPSIANDYDTHFDRAQQALAANNQYTSEIANADTQKANSDLVIAANDAMLAINNTALLGGSNSADTYNDEIYDSDQRYVAATTNNQVAATEQLGAIAATSGVANAAMSAAGSLATGNVMGAVGAIGGGIIDGVSTVASTAVGVNLTTSQATETGNRNARNRSAARSDNYRRYGIAETVNNDTTDTQNDLTEGTTDNSVATSKANSGRTLNTAQSAIANQIAQAALNDAREFGQAGNGENATTRPMGLFANVVTQNDYAIRRAGDEFLRYGYMFGGLWPFNGNWNVGKHFTYWKASDFWITGLSVPDMYVDRIRFFLFGGVTVWRNPSDIGNTTIYENM